MKLVKVIWRDIRTLTHSWKDVPECVEEAEKLWEDNFETIGYLIHSNPNYLLVASTTDSEEYNDVSMIPISVVKEVIEL